MAYRFEAENFHYEVDGTKFDDIHTTVLALNEKLQNWKKERAALESDYEQLSHACEELNKEYSNLEDYNQSQAFHIQELEDQLAKKQAYLHNSREYVEKLQQILEEKKQEQVAIRNNYQERMQQLSHNLMEAHTKYSRQKLTEEINILREKEKELYPKLKAAEKEKEELEERFRKVFGESEECDHTGVFGLKIVISQMESQLEKIIKDKEEKAEEAEKLAAMCKKLEEQVNLFSEE